MFNAVSYVKEMRKAGFTEQQAEILMQCQIDVMNSHFATREDISELKGELNSKIDGVKNELNEKIGELDTKVGKLDTKIENIGYRMTIKLGSIMAIGLGIILSGFGSIIYLLIYVP